jgi:hypothetical protein
MYYFMRIMSKPSYETKLVKKEDGTFDVITKTKIVYTFTSSEEIQAKEFFQAVARQEMGYASGYVPNK